MVVVTEDWRRVENPISGETFTFIETSAESGGARVVTLIEVRPGGGSAPHAHPNAETFELVDGVAELSLDGTGRRLAAGEPVQVPGGAVHTFSNPSDEPATLKVTIVPPGDFERSMRAIAGLAREGRWPKPGERPTEPALMASLAVRSRIYMPPLPRPVYWPVMRMLAAIGRKACDEALPSYDREHPSPGERV